MRAILQRNRCRQRGPEAIRPVIAAMMHSRSAFPGWLRSIVLTASTVLMGFIVSMVLMVLMVLMAAPAQAEVKVDASLEPETAAVGEQVVLTVSVGGAVSLDQGPQVPSQNGLEVRSAGQSTSISIMNGRMSRSVVFSFVLFAQKPGSYTIGPVEVRDGGKSFQSAPLTLTITPGSGSAPRPGTTGGSVGSEPEESGNLFVRAEVDRDHATLGEQVTLRFFFYQRAGFQLLDQPQYNPPTSEGFWREDLMPQRNSTRTVRGIQYQVTELIYALFPTQTGRLTIGGGTLDCVVRERSRDPFSFFGGFSGGRQVRLQSKPIVIRVDPLPEPKPSDFTGGVGSYTLDTAVDRTEVAQTEPVTLTLTVKGEGNVSTVGDPVLPELVGFRSYPASSEVKTEHTGDVLRGQKTFSVVLVPESTGKKEIPSVKLSIFDPSQRRYVLLTSRAVPLTVSPARAGSASGEGGEVTLMGRDLRTIRPVARLRRSDEVRPWARSGFWFLQCVPLVLVGAAFAWRIRRQRREANWGTVLRRGAAGRLRRDLSELDRAIGGSGTSAAVSSASALSPATAFGRLDAALERYLTDRFHLPVRGMTREDLEARLMAAGVGEAEIAALKALLDRCDLARFAPSAQTTEDVRKSCADAARLPDLLERTTPPRPAVRFPLLLLIGGGMLLASSAPSRASAAARMDPASAAAAVSLGNEAYGKGDYRRAAREYGRVWAEGYESPDLLLNLGNASYRLGRLGWAVYYFERGRRLAPQDPDLKANLDLALQETKDRVPEGDTSRFLSSLVRLQDRLSLADGLRLVSRFWWLLLIYLSIRIAWGGGGGSAAGVWLGSRAGTILGGALGTVFVLALIWTGIKALQAGNSPAAVVVADELPVRSNPDPEATVEFTLHAGTRVRLGRAQNGFKEVRFSDKMRGWGTGGSLVELGAQGEAALAPADLEEIRGGAVSR